ncbi:MAG: hypothetical protein AAB907_04105 [Patescibacteria group bacterium]
MERYNPFYNPPKDSFSGGSSQDQSPDDGIMDELMVPAPEELPGTVEEIIYSEENGTKIWDVFKWFKNGNFGKDWVLGRDERRFAKDLVDFSQGKPTDFIIWNCIGFQWENDLRGGFPRSEITSNLDASIAWYFNTQIEEMSLMLSDIGNPNISIIIPSNEALDERVWKYTQPTEERNAIVDQAVAGLSEKFKTMPLQENVCLQVTRWDDFLIKRGAEKTQTAYSQEGENRIRKSGKIARITTEAIRSYRKYLEEKGIKHLRDDELANRRIMYYGVYAGEGVFYEEQKRKNRNTVVVNFEEMRVAQMGYLGSNGSATFVTPIKLPQMQEYYRFENSQLPQR